MFDIGDKVLVYRDHHDNAPRQRTVSKIQTTYVMLDDGSKFTKSGIAWGSSKNWFHSFIRHLDADLLAEVEAARAEQKATARKRANIKAIVRFVEHDMTPGELDRLAVHLRNMGMPAIEET